ncbi:MAG: hypothetical protein HRU40_05060 [Saprospiraceae bacterium]|nr:hypothetical protein [Saprospiraceae bacterium]
MKPVIYLAFILFSIPVAAQQFWVDAIASDWASTRSDDRPIQPNTFRAFDVEPAELQQTFLRLRSPQTLRFPMPDGSQKTFVIEPQSNFHPDLARKYPLLQAFTGYDPVHPEHRIGLTVGPRGLHAVLETDQGQVYIDPYQKGRSDRHMAYFTKDHEPPAALAGLMQCGNHGTHIEEWADEPLQGTSAGLRSNTDNVDLIVYDIAIATTAEYSNANGGTTASVLESLNEALTRINFIFVQDLAIRFQLIAENEQIIFFDANTDPYTDDNISSLLNQNQTALANILGPQKYDIGHVFAGPCGGGTVGQAALAGVCNTQRKARAASCQIGSNARFVTNVVAHEIGHQLSATHTFNNCPQNEGQTSPSSAFEPGGGSTIMSYANACGSQSYQNGADPYFHVHSIQQMFLFSRNSSGNNCSEVIQTDNLMPEINLPYPQNLVIPISTPFKLTAEAYDPDSSGMTFCWEQYDIDPISSTLGAPQGNDPSFRSYEPVTSPTRYFPRLLDIIIGNESRVEVLPDYERNLKFRCTVRDNDLEASGVIWEEIQLGVTESAGPFKVIAPNRNLTYTGGREYEIRWDVANTDRGPVNCKFVNVLLSVDRGTSIYDTLAAQTLNDGSVYVTFPDVETTRGRVFIEAVGNVFYDASDEDFNIIPAADSTYAVKVNPAGIPLSCQPEIINVQVITDSINGYNGHINLSLAETPDGITYNFVPNLLYPGDTAILHLLPTLSGRQTYNLVVRTESDADTFDRELVLVTQSNDYEGFRPTLPADGTSGILLSTDFAWSPSVDAESYTVEIARDPTFSSSALIERRTGITDTTYVPAALLDESSLFFWRVQPENICGPGNYSSIQSFHTANTTCDESEAGDTPINISGTGLPTIESKILIQQQGTVSDINIPFIKANYQPVNSLRITLISPSGTEVILFDENCGNTVNLSLGFDDDAPREIVCPPDDGIVFQPVQSLAAFNGESITGEWILRVAVVELGFGA